jgi:hypothetical protein
MPTSSSKSFLKSSYKSSSLKRGKDDSSTIIVTLAVLLFIIIGGVIIYNSYYKERFTNNANQPNKLVYLYMEKCGFCKEFNEVWKEMLNENKPEYKINMEKYDINDQGKGNEISKANKINYAPAIILITPSGNFLYEGERTKLQIFKWVSTKV